MTPRSGRRWKSGGYDHLAADHEKLSTKGSISWRQTRPFTCCGKNQRPEETRSWFDNGWVHRATCTECGTWAVSNEHAGFRANALYTTFRNLESIVKDWLDAQGDRAKLRQFVNETLAETFESDDQQVHFEAKPEMLAARVEVPWDKVPAGVKYITAGVDNQTGEANGKTDQTRARLECEVVGWGDGDESWSLGYHVIPGDPATSEPWDILEEDILLKPFETEDGRILYIQACGVDAGGHHRKSVEEFCAGKDNRRVWTRVLRSALREADDDMDLIVCAVSDPLILRIPGLGGLCHLSVEA
ncbi:terminase gpA endonuclease subunit, partial [Paracoccus angustae]